MSAHGLTRLLQRRFLQYGIHCTKVSRANIIPRNDLVMPINHRHHSNNKNPTNTDEQSKVLANAKNAKNAKTDGVVKIAEKKESNVARNEEDEENFKKSTKIIKTKDNAMKNENSKSTKTIEIQTTKGILSVTTTIEDSKINDVILEKTSTAAGATKVQPVKSESTKSIKNNQNKKNNADKDKGTTQNLTKTATESIKKVVGAFIKPNGETTTKTTITTTPTPTTNDTITKDKKEYVGGADGDNGNAATKTVKSTVKAIEKLAAAAAAAATGATTTSATTTTNTTTAPTKGETPVQTRPPKPPRVLVDFNRSSLERNFITPGRAMSDFLLKATDLENLPKIKRRSPYEQEPPMTVFWRRDVESKAIEVWGSRENLLKEQLKRDVERKKHQQSILTIA